jgi:glycosyltransferase involved in cell wall biosynthesis
MPQAMGALHGKRFLVAAEYIQYGGTRTYFQRLLNFYHEHGAYVCIVTSHNQADPEMESFISNLGFDSYSFASFARQFGLDNSHSNPTVWSIKRHHSEVSAFKELVDAFDLDRVTISVGTSGLFLSAAAAASQPIMIAHGYPHGRRQEVLGSRYLSRMIPHGLKIISVSDYSKLQFMRNWSSKSSELSLNTIYSTVGTQQMGIRASQRPNKVLTAALLEEYKRPLDWLEIARRTKLSTQSNDLTFEWLGDGPQREKAIQESRNLRLPFVTFPGWVDDPSSNYRSAKVYLQTSSIESLGLSVVDALRHGVPAVVSSAGGLPEVVENGVNGFVFAVGDVSMAAHWISELLNDGKLWREQSDAALALYQNRFSPEKWNREMLAVHIDVEQKEYP